MNESAKQDFSTLAGKYLTFALGAERYGLQILQVQEIIGMMPVTRIPRTPDFMRGVINLRGKIIPVIDVRKKFGMEAREDVRDTCIIVVLTRGIEIGIVVDSVCEVMHIVGDEIDAPPDLGRQVDTHFLFGLAKREAHVTLLLDIDEVLSSDELHRVRGTAKAETVSSGASPALAPAPSAGAPPESASVETSPSADDTMPSFDELDAF